MGRHIVARIGEGAVLERKQMLPNCSPVVVEFAHGILRVARNKWRGSLDNLVVLLIDWTGFSPPTQAGIYRTAFS